MLMIRNLTGHPETRFGLDNNRYQRMKSSSFPCKPFSFLLDLQFQIPDHLHRSKMMKLALNFEQVHPLTLQLGSNFRNFPQTQSSCEPYFHHQRDQNRTSLLNLEETRKEDRKKSRQGRKHMFNY